MENIISVVVVTYNQKSTIARTLNSILAQKCHLPFEIIIGDDCSTDGTREVCKEYVRRFPDIVRLISNKKNKGVVDNYFDCLLECRGKYIADCAGDDFWIDERKLEKEANILENDCSVTLVHTNWYFYDEKTKKQFPNNVDLFRNEITDGRNMLESIVTQTDKVIIHLCTAMYRADVFRKVYEEDINLFRNKDFTCEDVQIAFAMAINGNIAYIPDYTLNYSYGVNESISYSKDSRKQYIFFKGVTELSFYLCNKYNISSSHTEWYFRHRLFALAMHSFRGMDKSLKNDVLFCAKRWHARMKFKTLALLAIMNNEVTWTLALYMRKILIFFIKSKKVGLVS